MTPNSPIQPPPASVPRIQQLETALAYQDGAVVSKTLMKKKGGSVTLFAFDKGQALSEHTAPFDALVHLLDGSCEIVISGELFLLKKGDSIVLPAHHPHGVSAVERFKMVLTMVRTEEDP